MGMRRAARELQLVRAWVKYNYKYMRVYDMRGARLLNADAPR